MKNIYDFTDTKKVAIFSVHLAEKILGIEDSLEVIFKENSGFVQEDISAAFIKKGYYIAFNESFLKSASPIEIMITGFHEVRHAYQYMQIEYGNKLPFKYRDDPGIINEWEKNFNDSRKVNEMTREEYLNKATEIDAIAFSSYLADKLLNVKQIIPEEIMNKVSIRILALKLLF